MTREQAAAAFKEIWPEIDARLLAARPQLKSFEAHIVTQKAREAIIAGFAGAQSTDDIRALALPAFAGLSYLKTSPFSTGA